MARGNEKWRALSDKDFSGGVVRLIDNDVAMGLLEAVVKDSAVSFTSSVEHFVIADRKLKKAKRALEQLLIDDKEKHDALKQFIFALKTKEAAVIELRNESVFLSGGRDLKPPIDGEYVMIELIKSVLGGLEDELYDDAIEIIELHRARNKKRKTKEED